MSKDIMESKDISESLNSDLTVVGLVLLIFVLAFPITKTQLEVYNKESKIEKLQTEYREAQELVVDLHDKTEEQEKHISALYNDLNELKAYKRIKEELRSYTTREKAVGLGVGFSESSWNHEANHQGLYSNFCGNMPWHWDDMLEERNVDPKGAGACVEIYKHYKDIYGSRYAAIKAYKGIEKNTHIIKKTEKYIDVAYRILKEHNI